MRVKSVVVVMLTALCFMVMNAMWVSPVQGQNLSTRSDDPTDPLINPGPKKEAIGKQVMVSTQVPCVTETAVNVMREGGNAFDAFITAVLLQIVVEPHMVSHWGIMTGVIYDAKKDEYICFDGIGERPLASRSDKGDPMKVSIGGTIKALGDIGKRYGSKPWASYFGPAIHAAEEGVLVTPYMYGILYAAWENTTDAWPGGVRDLIDNKEARDFYMPGGFLVPPGKRWKMPKLARHLKKLAAEGADYMYTGEWAKKFVEESNKLGGRVSVEDMAEYEVIWREPLRFTYKGYEIVSEAPPIYGGLIVGYNLNILENFDLKKMGHFSESPEALEIMVRTADRVFWEFSRLKDPRNYYVPTDLLLSKEYGKMGAEFVRNTRLRPGVSLAPPEKDEDAKDETLLTLHQELKKTGHTFDSNHNIIVDSKGNWISSLHSGHGGTPGYFFDGVEANGSDVPSDVLGPGRRHIAPLPASIVLKDGKPWLSLGTPGYPPQPVTEVLINILEYGMDPKEAVEAIRFWQPSDDGKTVRIESRISEELRKGMAARGFKLVDLTDYNWHTGSMQVIWRDDSGKLHGVTDPRRLGHANGF